MYNFLCLEELLCSTAALVDVVLDKDEDLLRQWIDEQLVHSLCHAIDQTM